VRRIKSRLYLYFPSSNLLPLEKALNTVFSTLNGDIATQIDPLPFDFDIRFNYPLLKIMRDTRSHLCPPLIFAI